MKEHEEIERTFGEWSAQIPDAAEHREKILVAFTKIIEDAGVPEMKWKIWNTMITPSQAVVGLLTKGKRPLREVFAITMTTLPGYAVEVDAREYGENLLVTWRVVFNKYRLGFLRDLAQDAGWLDPLALAPSQEQDFAALKMITQDALKKVVEDFGKQRDEDFSIEDERSRGIETVDFF